MIDVTDRLCCFLSVSERDEKRKKGERGQTVSRVARVFDVATAVTLLGLQLLPLDEEGVDVAYRIAEE